MFTVLTTKLFAPMFKVISLWLLALEDREIWLYAYLISINENHTKFAVSPLIVSASKRFGASKRLLARKDLAFHNSSSIFGSFNL